MKHDSEGGFLEYLRRTGELASEKRLDTCDKPASDNKGHSLRLPAEVSTLFNNLRLGTSIDEATVQVLMRQHEMKRSEVCHACRHNEVKEARQMLFSFWNNSGSVQRITKSISTVEAQNLRLVAIESFSNYLEFAVTETCPSGLPYVVKRGLIKHLTSATLAYEAFLWNHLAPSFVPQLLNIGKENKQLRKSILERVYNQCAVKRKSDCESTLETILRNIKDESLKYEVVCNPDLVMDWIESSRLYFMISVNSHLFVSPIEYEMAYIKSNNGLSFIKRIFDNTVIQLEPKPNSQPRMPQLYSPKESNIKSRWVAVVIGTFIAGLTAYAIICYYLLN